MRVVDASDDLLSTDHVCVGKSTVGCRTVVSVVIQVMWLRLSRNISPFCASPVTGKSTNFTQTIWPDFENFMDLISPVVVF